MLLRKNQQKQKKKIKVSLYNDKNSWVKDIFVFLYLPRMDFYDIVLLSKTNVFKRETGGRFRERR